MQVELLRSGSKGLEGTYANIDHHAKKTKPIVDLLVKQFDLLQHNIKRWRQGHNTHVIEAYDGRSLVFTPYSNGTGVVGVQVGIYVSRTVRVKLFHLATVSEVASFTNFLRSFLESETNYYGVR